MSELPQLTGRQALAAFEKAGFELVRVRGSHHVLKKQDHPYLLTVPVHANRPLKKGTLRRLIRDAGLTVEDFIRLLD